MSTVAVRLFCGRCEAGELVERNHRLECDRCFAAYPLAWIAPAPPAPAPAPRPSSRTVRVRRLVFRFTRTHPERVSELAEHRSSLADRADAGRRLRRSYVLPSSPFGAWHPAYPERVFNVMPRRPPSRTVTQDSPDPEHVGASWALPGARPACGRKVPRRRPAWADDLKAGDW